MLIPGSALLLSFRVEKHFAVIFIWETASEIC